ncbi:ribonuclease E inhibitor RraB [Ectobacillus sp. JY-23]|uniref:ribonuclease E inhibitor RraB n=1 Tax=Ectobacillus sp. JY-23 TaxID=2933872 RepID=UPI001FF0E60E|nr:ribonuclease E inhibitor RraB [Ectobacillus sp. JY-23]UOY92393.1 ribonuclease E inhibitor RraB [Ectobacillus sp. JY-23]
METIKQRNRREQFDTETIQALVDAGSNLSKMHYVEHCFFLDDEETAHKVASSLHKQGYEIYEPQEAVDDDGTPFLVMIVGKQHMITPEIVFEETRKMTELAIKYTGFAESYDGWETKVME